MKEKIYKVYKFSYRIHEGKLWKAIFIRLVPQWLGGYGRRNKTANENGLYTK